MQVWVVELKKSTRKFVLSNETLNSHGFKVRTSGIDLSGFKKNPLLLWMHQRPAGKTKDEILPLGSWVDLEIKDGELWGTPAFDTNDEFSMKIYHKVENGTIRMASAGLSPKDWDMISEESWLMTSKLVEGSLVDVGSNPSSLAVHLYDESGVQINLSADYLSEVFKSDPSKTTHLKTETENMETIPLSANTLALIKLKADAKPADVESKIVELVNKTVDQATEIIQLKKDKSDLELDIAEKKDEITELKGSEETIKLKALKEEAVTRDRKVTEESWNELVKLGYDGAKKVLDTMSANPTAASVLEGKKPSNDEAELDRLSKLSFDELDKSNQLVRLKALSLDVYNTKGKEKFGAKWTEAKK